LRLDDDVLEDLVDRVADVDLAVGVGRAVVQHEARAVQMNIRGREADGATALVAVRHAAEIR
jgi:hypothetical protein